MSIFDRIKNIMEEQDVATDFDVTLDTSFEELDIDSLTIVDLTMSCEEEFGIELDVENVPKTVGELVEIIAELTGEEA